MRISNGIQNRNRRMRNRTYGGVRGRKTKVGRKLLRFPPTRFYPTGTRKYLREIFFYLSEIFLYLSEKIIYPTEFLFLSNQFSNFPKTKRCAHEYNDNANQPIKPITITDHENQEQHQEQNQKLKDTESETKSR